MIDDMTSYSWLQTSIVIVVIAYYIKQNEWCFQHVQLYLNKEVKII